MMAADQQYKYAKHLNFYHGLLPRDDINMMLINNGDYLLRLTGAEAESKDRQLVLSLMVDQARRHEGIKHFVIYATTGKFSIAKYAFNSIDELVAYYTKVAVQEGCPMLGKAIPRNKWELQHECIEVGSKLGEGAFGAVMKAHYKSGNVRIPVAVKCAKLEALTKEQIKEVMAEAKLMRRFKHPNVIRSMGIAAGNEPLMVVMELVNGGSLISFLKKNVDLDNLRYEIMAQTAYGLAHIHSKKIMHRDIAARNCLIQEKPLCVKLSDFGLSREGTSFQCPPTEKMALRWQSPEVLITRNYTLKSDIWSWGVLVWEIFHEGSDPFLKNDLSKMSGAEVTMNIRNGNTLPFRTGKGYEDLAKVQDFIKQHVWVREDHRKMMKDVITFMKKDFATELKDSRDPRPPKKCQPGSEDSGGVDEFLDMLGMAMPKSRIESRRKEAKSKHDKEKDSDSD